MKTNHVLHAGLALLSALLLLPRAMSAAPDRPVGQRADRQRYIKDEIHFALKADFAGELSPADERRHPVDSERIRGLHRHVAQIVGGHICAENWLWGKSLPKHIHRNLNEVPEIARSLTAVLREGVDAAEILDEFRQLPEVEWASLSLLYELAEVPNDPLYNLQWAPPRIHAEEAWDVTPATTAISIAIVDTGVDLQHPDLAGRITYGRSFTSTTSGGDAPRDGRTGADHGTHVAGIAAAIRDNRTGVAGVAQANIMALACASWSLNSMRYALNNVENAMNDAVGQGANVINCSFSQPDTMGNAMKSALNNARSHNVLVVVAAGNSETDVTGIQWDQHPAPLIVSSTAPDDTLSSSFSNFGSAIDLAAPGGTDDGYQTNDIYSSVIGGYDYKAGTSMASPCVAGAAALVIGMNPALMEDDGTKHVLYRMAVDLTPPGKDDQFGRGRLNLSRSFLQSLRNADACVGYSPGVSTQNGRYDTPYAGIGQAIASVRSGATLVLNGGLSEQAEYTYPPMTLATPITLTALPDKPVTIGR